MSTDLQERLTSDVEVDVDLSLEPTCECFYNDVRCFNVATYRWICRCALEHTWSFFSCSRCTPSLKQALESHPLWHNPPSLCSAEVIDWRYHRL